MPLSLGGALRMTEAVTGNPIRFVGTGFSVSVSPCVGVQDTRAEFSSLLSPFEKG